MMVSVCRCCSYVGVIPALPVRYEGECVQLVMAVVMRRCFAAAYTVLLYHAEEGQLHRLAKSPWLGLH